MSSNQYVPGPLVQEEDPNPVVVPKQAKRALGSHVFNPNLDAEGKRIGYQRVEYDRAANEYPKVLYHREFGAQAKPEIADFAAGAKTAAEIEKANAAYQKAMNKWNRSNRMKSVANEKEEERLVKIGWLTAPPKRTNAAEFDLNSDQL